MERFRNCACELTETPVVARHLVNRGVFVASKSLYVMYLVIKSMLRSDDHVSEKSVGKGNINIDHLLDRTLII